MDQQQIIKKYVGYYDAVKADEKRPVVSYADTAALLTLAEVMSNLTIGIKKQAWKDLADEVSDL
jgi:hypothetical protein